MATSLADAQRNAISRVIEAHGRLPMPDELRRLGKADPRFLGPAALFRYEHLLEPPVLDEGFSAIEARPFARRPVKGERRALVMDSDDLVANVAGAAVRNSHDLALLPGRTNQLQRRARDGWLLFAQAWRPPTPTGETADAMEACFARTRELLGCEITLVMCPHAAGPPVCWCRKPLPGLVMEFAMRCEVHLPTSHVVGRSSVDRTLADRLGMQFRDSRSFFAGE